MAENKSRYKDVLTENVLRDMYIAKNMTLREIGCFFGANSQTVLNYLKKYNIERRKRLARIPLKAEKCSNWNGGKCKRADGYIYVKCYNHPHSHHDYVLEHRLVMEKIIGRYLLPTEVVHHTNGKRSDNRPENLKLFSSTKEHTVFHEKNKSNKKSSETKRKQSVARKKYWARKRNQQV